MDFAAVLLEIEAEIERLKQIRAIVARLQSPVRRRRQKPVAQPFPSPELPVSEPRLVVLPPVRKREYRPRVRSVVRALIALAPAPVDRPVFVPRAATHSTLKLPNATVLPKSSEQIEAAIRQNLLGGVA